MNASAAPDPRRKLLGPDLSRPGGIAELALVNPQLVVALLGGCNPKGEINNPNLIGWGEPSCGWGWEIWNVRAAFAAIPDVVPLVFPQDVTARPDNYITSDLWVRDVVVTVRRNPLVYFNSVLKEQSDEFFKKNNFIDVDFIVQSYCRYAISATPTPLENFEQQFSCVCPVGLVLGCSTNVEARFVRNADFPLAFYPISITVSFHGVRLPTPWGACGYGAACAALQKHGLYHDCVEEDAAVE